MADAKISELPAATLPLAGTELVPIVQGAETRKVAASELGGGGGIADDAVTTPKIANDAVTFAKMQNVASGTILGRGLAGSGDVAEITVGAGLSITGGGVLSASTLFLSKTGSSSADQVARFTGTGVTIKNSQLTVSDDGILRSATNTGANAVSVPLVNWLMQTADYTLTSTTAEQKAFDTTTNGRLTLPTGVYYFDCWLYLTTMSATSGNFAFDPIGAGTAVTDRWGYNVYGIDSTTPLNAGTQTGSATVTQQTVASAVTGAAGTGAQVRLSGMFRISTGGTIIPSLSLVTANAAVVKAGSWFRIEKIGESSETSVGAWT